MAGLVPFANVTVGHTPDLDFNFNLLAKLITIPCTASGTNTIALAPVGNVPAIAAYTDQTPQFSFFAAASSTGAMTLDYNGLGAKKVYKNNGQTLAGNNDFISGALYRVVFEQALDGGTGGFIITNQSVFSNTTAGSVPGKTQTVIINGTSDTNITITAAAIALWDGSASFFTALGVNVTINAATNGANGLDTGGLGPASWYAIYVIYNPGTNTVAGLLSLNFTTPAALPSGYTMYARVGAIITDGSAHLNRISQKGNRAQYVVSLATTLILPVMASGVAGTYSLAGTPTWVAVAAGQFVPPTASAIFIVITQTYNNLGAADVQVAPNNTIYTGPRTTKPPPYSSITGTAAPVVTLGLELETSNLYWASSGAGGAIQCLGWEDNL